MSVSTTLNRITYAGNGSTTAFSFPYKFLDDTHLVVKVRTNTTGAESTKTITTHYTATGEGEDSGGTVTMVTAPATGETLIIYNDPPITQDLDLVENDPMPAEELEERFDKLTLISQRLKSRMDRAVGLSDGFSPTFDPILPVDLDDAGGKVPLVNDDGDGWADAADWPDAADIAAAGANATAAAASASAAAISASAASTSASAAATSATAAQAAVNSVFFRDVVYITSADSPFTVTSSHRGKLISANAASGAISITFPAIAGLDLTTAFVVGVQKSDTSANAVTVNRGSTDVFNPGSATSKVLTSQGVAAIFTPDTDQAPDEWLVSDQGLADAGVTPLKLATASIAANSTLNLGLSVAMAANAVTIALKDAAGNDPSSTSPVRIPFRNATLTTGTPSFVNVTGSLSTVISSGSTGGAVSGAMARFYIYAINNAGTIELAWAGANVFDENNVVTTTAEGGAGGADSSIVMYSTTARTNVAFRYIGFYEATQVTAGTHATAASKIGLFTDSIPKSTAVYQYDTTNGYGSTNTKIAKFTNNTTTSDPSTLLTVVNSATLGFSATANRPCRMSFHWTSNQAAGDYAGISKNSNQLTTEVDTITKEHCLMFYFTSGSVMKTLTATVNLNAGDVVRPHTGGSAFNSDALNRVYIFAEEL